MHTHPVPQPHTRPPRQCTCYRQSLDVGKGTPPHTHSDRHTATHSRPDTNTDTDSQSPCPRAVPYHRISLGQTLQCPSESHPQPYPQLVSRHTIGVLVTCHPQNQGCDQGADHPRPGVSCWNHGHCTLGGGQRAGRPGCFWGPLPHLPSFPAPFPRSERNCKDTAPQSRDYRLQRSRHPAPSSRAKREDQERAGVNRRPELDADPSPSLSPSPGLTCCPQVGGGEPAPRSATDFSGLCRPAATSFRVITTY